jgi:hypothetical protein
MYLINLIKGGFHSPPDETFNLDDLSGGSQEGGDTTVAPDSGPATPGHRHRRKEKQPQKAGSKKGKSTDDVQSFFQVVDEKKLCKFCM